MLAIHSHASVLDSLVHCRFTYVLLLLLYAFFLLCLCSVSALLCPSWASDTRLACSWCLDRQSSYYRFASSMQNWTYLTVSWYLLTRNHLDAPNKIKAVWMYVLTSCGQNRWACGGSTFTSWLQAIVSPEHAIEELPCDLACMSQVATSQVLAWERKLRRVRWPAFCMATNYYHDCASNILGTTAKGGNAEMLELSYLVATPVGTTNSRS